VGRDSSSPFRAQAPTRNTKSAKRRPRRLDQWNTDRDTMIRNSERESTPTTTTSNENMDGTAPGPKFRITVRCGVRTLRPAGLRIAMAAGSMSRIGDGPGFRMTIGLGSVSLWSLDAG